MPGLKNNLLSVGKITNNDFNVLFKKNAAQILDHKGKCITTARRTGDLYYVAEESQVANHAKTIDTSRRETMKWHRKLAHLNFTDLQILAKRSNIELDKSTREPDIKCDVCIRGKMASMLYPEKSERSTEILEIIQTIQTFVDR